LVGHWSDSGTLVHGSCHFEQDEVATNVVSVESNHEGEVPVGVLEWLILHFSCPEELVYGTNISPGENCLSENDEHYLLNSPSTSKKL
jgi:hypothetical protein